MIRGRTPAETCRLNHWPVGTVLIGNEGYGDETIRITAIGENEILAKRLTNTKGEAIEDPRESLWTLGYREWREVTHTSPTPPSEAPQARPASRGV